MELRSLIILSDRRARQHHPRLGASADRPAGADPARAAARGRARCALFTRANRGVRLTEAGQKLLESAQRILRDVERAGDEIRAHKAHPSGKIILGVTPTLCPVVVPELFSRMRGHYPMIELKVVHAGTVRLEEFIVAGLVDLALMAEISRSRLIAVDPARRRGDGAGDAPRHAAAGCGFGRRAEPHAADPRRRAARRARCAARRARHRVAGRHRAQRPRDHKADGQQGVGASILPHSSVYRECARGLAQAHRITAAGVFRTLALGSAANRGSSAARQAVAEVVSAVLGDIEADGKLRPHLANPVGAAPSRSLTRTRGRVRVGAGPART